ncbi:DUF1822 family protein [Oscillatoria sp. FACHB-1407]|uniref:DUF1822 family protein n=1 Tax=Oscillatoria sp. FACHB-1407 TaxID=2692847 RepID=UPI00168657E3|nr:DUF1822 family protein [Oscillatoria sp. FACHB-1407]MBD2464602.1 DUF1822 family protein [Oscillatoria sp. FACHB-1407]
MTYSTHDTDSFALPLPITQHAQRIAQQFANQQPTPQKAEQVRLNTLAVIVIHDYLEMLGIATDLTQSDSWNPVTRLCADVADLQIAGLGRLECRPLASADPVCPVPPEVWEDRVGYAVVQIDPQAEQAALLGFVPTVEDEELPLSQLRSPEELLDHLDRLLHPATQMAIAPSVAATAEQAFVTLSQWFQHQFAEGWQTVESLLNPQYLNPAYGFRGATSTEPNTQESRVRRAKLIDLGIQFNRQPIALVVELQPTATESTQVCLQVHPTQDQSYLPPDLRLTVLDESGATFLEAESRAADNYIQLQFSGTAGERFGVQITLGNSRVYEEFMI